MRCVLLLAATISAATAWAQPPAELPEGVGAVRVQEATAFLLRDDKQADTAPTHLPAGWWYSVAGHQRLHLALAQLQADKLAAEARAEALQQALQLRADPAPQVSTTAVVGLAVLLVVAGGVAGYSLAM